MRRALVASGMIVVATAGVAAAQTASVAPRVSGAPAQAMEIERARSAAKELTGELRARLMEEMASGGALQAVEVCSEVAQQMAARYSKEGVKVRRVSERWRNAADRPDAFEAERLRKLEAAHREGKLPEELCEWVGSGAWRTLRYLKPIVISGPCLACHGDPAAMDPAVLAAIRERYPEDKAVGYKDGDVRGAVSVIVAAPR